MAFNSSEALTDRYMEDGLTASGSETDDPQPVYPSRDVPKAFASPYTTSEMIKLLLQSSETHYLIHSQILQKSTPLYALATKRPIICVPELDEQLAHPLIHYLYSGTLEWIYPCPNEGRLTVATRMYSVAIRYELPGLAELAKGEIIRSSEELDILSIVYSVKGDKFLSHLDNDTWYWQHIEDVFQSAMEKNPEPFKRPGFINNVAGNSLLLHIVWKVVMSNFTPGSFSTSSVRDLGSGAETPLVASTLAGSELTTQDSLDQLPSPTESVVDSPPILEQADDLIEPQKLELDASISTDQHTTAHPEPEKPVQDTVDGDNSTRLPDGEAPASQSQAMKIVAVPIEDVKEPEHIRADSVVAEDAVAPVGLKKKNKKKFKSKKKDPPAAV